MKNGIKNTLVFHDYYSRLKMIALSMFDWEGLPESCNARFLERCLFENGMAIFIDDPDMGFLNLRVTPSGTLNPYDEPVAYTAYSTGYTGRKFDAEDCVIIRNNPLNKSTDSTIMLYAEKLADIDRSITVNVKAQKTPVLVECDEKMRKTLLELYRQYEGNEPFILGYKGLSDKPLNSINTGAPFVADKLREEKCAVWNECLEFLGLNTNPSDKKRERLIVSEVDANNEQIDIQVEAMLACRREACKAINKKYGLNVSVKKRVQEVKPDGEIYDRTEGHSKQGAPV